MTPVIVSLYSKLVTLRYGCSVVQADFESLRHLKAIRAARCWLTAEVPDCEQSVTTVPVGVPTTPFCRDRRRQSTGRYFTGDR